MTDREKATKSQLMLDTWRESILKLGRDPTLNDLSIFMETVKSKNFLNDEELSDFRKTTKLICGLASHQLAMSDDTPDIVVNT